MWPTILRALGVAVLLTVVMTVLTDCSEMGDSVAENTLIPPQMVSKGAIEEEFLVTSVRPDVETSENSTKLHGDVTSVPIDLDPENASLIQVSQGYTLGASIAPKSLQISGDLDTLRDQVEVPSEPVESYPGKQTSFSKSQEATGNENTTLETRLITDTITRTSAKNTSSLGALENAESVHLRVALSDDKSYDSSDNVLEDNEDPEVSTTEMRTSRGQNSAESQGFLGPYDQNEHSNEGKTKDSKSTAHDHLGTGINQLGPKSTKSFYEIKSLLTTETVDTGELREPGSPGNARKFIRPTIPWVASAKGKYGPYFEDGPEDKNITARIGSTVLLDCKIGMLHDKTVTWLQHSKDSIHLLTVGRQLYSADQRVSLSFRYPSNWRLQIAYASPRDSGLYECQVATHPPRIKKINLIVTAPVLTIVDDAGRVVAGERHLKAGTFLKLSCEVKDVRPQAGESVVWTKGDETLVEEVSQNKTVGTVAGEEVQVVVSTISVERATPRDAGNYSCLVPGRTKKTVFVHVLNGELPAAVHDGNGVSRAVLNLWLVHVTISYVFSR